MSSVTPPTEHAIIAHVADAPTAEAVMSALTDELDLDPERIEHGGGPELAERLSRTEDDDDGHPIVSWLLSLGQEREELVRLGEAVRDGRQAVFVHCIDEREQIDAVADVLRRHDAHDIAYFGDWQVEDLSISR